MIQYAYQILSHLLHRHPLQHLCKRGYNQIWEKRKTNRNLHETRLSDRQFCVLRQQHFFSTSVGISRQWIQMHHPGISSGLGAGSRGSEESPLPSVSVRCKIEGDLSAAKQRSSIAFSLSLSTCCCKYDSLKFN